MKQALILLTSLILFACGGGEPENSAEDTGANVIDDVANTMHRALDKAEAVEDLIMENKEAMDEVIEDATD